MENESRYSIKKAQYSLDIGDHMNIDNQWLINRIKTLESRASLFESTLKETMKTSDELNEKLKIAIEALETIANEVEIDTDTYRQYIDTIVGNRIKAKQALAKINKPPTAEQYFNQFKHEGSEDCIMPNSRKEIEGY